MTDQHTNQNTPHDTSPAEDATEPVVEEATDRSVSLKDAASAAEQPEQASIADAPGDAATSTLATQLEAALAQSEEYKDALQRERADFSNYRKRIEREKRDLRKVIAVETLSQFLPIVDDFERALSNAPQDVRAADWMQGFDLIAKKFQNLLAQYGIETIDPLGEPFDHNFHDAISTEPTDEYDSGTVIDVLQKGYALDGKCIRPAIVRVAE